METRPAFLACALFWEYKAECVTLYFSWENKTKRLTEPRTAGRAERNRNVAGVVSEDVHSTED